MSDDIESRIASLREANEQVMRDLGREGVALDSVSMLKMRLDYVTDFILGDDHERMLQFQLGWEQALNDALSGAVAEIRRAKLQVLDGGLVVPRG